MTQKVDVQAVERRMLHQEWAWQRTAMDHAFAYEQFLSPWARAFLAAAGADFATHRQKRVLRAARDRGLT